MVKIKIITVTLVKKESLEAAKNGCKDELNIYTCRIQVPDYIIGVGIITCIDNYIESHKLTEYEMLNYSVQTVCDGELGIIDLGLLELTTGTLDITDPCYEKGIWCRGTLHNVKKGSYIVEAEKYDSRIRSLSIKHIDFVFNDIKYADFEVGVDSGLCGFFEDKPDYTDEDDRAIFNYSQSETNNFTKPFTKVVTPDTPFKCNGVVTDSGYGDGSYQVRYNTNSEGLIDYVEIEFIDPDICEVDNYE